MKKTFYQLDVFTETPFHGNPLAVFPDGQGLSTPQMQAIAAEMNLSETVFVLPSDKALRRLRIFTPKQELPLAGHPVVGTWNLLARLGVVEPVSDGTVTIEHELSLGVLPVEIAFGNGQPSSVMMTQGAFECADTISDDSAVARLADALGLSHSEICNSESMPIQTSSTGIRAMDVPVASLDALSRININSSLLTEIYTRSGAIGCYAFCFETKETTSKVHARFFAPDDGITEDPATGSAAGSLGGYLLHHGIVEASTFVIEQGDFMSRPSRITVQVDGSKSRVERVRVGGRACVVAKGELFVDGKADV